MDTEREAVCLAVWILVLSHHTGKQDLLTGIITPISEDPGHERFGWVSASAQHLADPHIPSPGRTFFPATEPDKKSFTAHSEIWSLHNDGHPCMGRNKS